MNREQYKRFECFETMLQQLFVNSEIQEIEIDTILGNELFQRCSDAAFEVFKKYDTDDPTPSNDIKLVG